jgi:hypothetical protein
MAGGASVLCGGAAGRRGRRDGAQGAALRPAPAGGRAVTAARGGGCACNCGDAPVAAPRRVKLRWCA